MSWNRRKQKKYLLDVKVHTEVQTRQRMRWLGALALCAVVLGLTGYGCYRLAKFGASKLVWENPRFAVSQIQVESNGVLTPVQVMQFAGLQPGQNAWAIDLAQVRRNLELIPLVKRVEVRRQLPQRLIIRIEERVAVARLQPANRELRDAQFYVDRNGVVMKPIRLAAGPVIQPQTVGPVPLLTGVALTDVQLGRPVESEQIYRALELLNKLAQTAAGASLEIAQVDLSKPRHMTLTTKQNLQVRFDVQDLNTQMRRLSVILSWAQQQRKTVASVDLTVARGVPVTFVN
jgi:cell division protein FtsQ